MIMYHENKKLLFPRKRFIIKRTKTQGGEDMITEAFDNQSPAIINPQIRENTPQVDACILTFSHVIEKFVLEQVNIFIENLEVKVLPAIMGKSMDYAKNIINFVSFFVVMLIAVLLIMKDYDRVIAKLREEEELQGVREVGKKVILYVRTFIRAQIIILCIISTVCAVALALMGMQGGIFYGILTGVMDMLPFIGTGIMLVPLALFRLINGSYLQAVLCLCLYAVCALIREFLEPKLIGERVGVWPVGILFAVFAGIHLFGVWGIIKGPLSLVIICETSKYWWGKLEEAEK